MNEEDRELERIKRRKMVEWLRKMRSAAEPSREVSARSRPIELSDENIGSVVESHPLVVVDCWAPWCAPCRMIAPVIEELAEDYAGKILFGKLNVDENPRTAIKYQIMSIPTLLIFKNGRLIDRIIGAMPRRMLEPRITRHL